MEDRAKRVRSPLGLNYPLLGMDLILYDMQLE